MNTTTTDIVQDIPLEKVVYNRYQPRQTMDAGELEKLAQSILQNTMLQKPTARIQSDGCYELAFGHRRFEAYKLLAAQDSAYSSMPLIIRELTDEQMFDLAWDENEEREDLNPIDEGIAYATWMREFDKTSKDAGMRFKTSEENIRAKIRLGNLNESVKDKVRSGEINETAARSMLQLQKIASPEVVSQTVAEIAKRKDQKTPDEIIQQVVQRLSDVVRLWDGDGAPRAGRDGWLLDMKNFPNKLLPLLTGHFAVQTLDCFNDKPAQKLVLEWAEYLSADSIGPEHENFDQEFHDACKGQAQKRLDALAEINPIYVEKLQHLINPPACNTCPFYTKIRGSHYCGMKICHTRKSIAWEAHLLEQASKNLKIPAYNKKTDGGYVLLVGYESSHKKVFTNRHAGLRLLLKSAAERYASQWGFEGVNGDNVFVVATGLAIDKLDSTGRNRSKGGKKTEKEKAEMRMMRVYRVRRKEFLWEFTAIAKSIFDGVSVDAIKKLQDWHSVSVDNAIPSEWLQGKRANAQLEADFERRELIWRMIDNMCSYYTRSSMLTILKKMQEQAGKWSVKIPARLTKLAEQFDAEINAAAAPKVKK